MYNKMLDKQRFVLGWIHCNMLGDEKKTLVSTLENQKKTHVKIARLEKK